MRPTGLAALAAAAADWSWVLRQQARAVVERGRADEFQQAPRGAPASCAEVPVVLLPGIWEPWQFLRPLATVLHAGGHPVHVVTELGWNGRDLDASADDVIAHLAAHDLRRVVLVAHSKGGLIGKKVLQHSTSAESVQKTAQPSLAPPSSPSVIYGPPGCHSGLFRRLYSSAASYSIRHATPPSPPIVSTDFHPRPLTLLSRSSSIVLLSDGCRTRAMSLLF